MAYRRNYEDMARLVKQEGIAIQEIDGDLRQPEAFLADLRLPSGSVVDISCFPRNHLLTFLQQPWAPSCQLVYSEVGEYEKDEACFAIGVRDIVCVRGYEGEVRNRPTLLCLALGFEGHRAMAIFRRYDPYRTLAFLGREAKPDLSDITRRNNSQLLANSGVHEYRAHCLDPHEFAEDFAMALMGFLEVEDARHHDFDIVVAVLGPKPQAIGVHYLVQAGLPAHVVYAIPNKRRICSHGIGSSYILRGR
jgi:hypothetical protein